MQPGAHRLGSPLTPTEASEALLAGVLETLIVPFPPIPWSSAASLSLMGGSGKNQESLSWAVGRGNSWRGPSNGEGRQDKDGMS